jgi:hypothetical protein
LTQWLFGEVEEDPAGGLERYHRAIGNGQGAAGLRRRFYEEWENAIVAVLADEANEARPTPRTRLIGAQLTGMLRVLSSSEVNEFVQRRPLEDRPAALKALIQEAADLISNGL